MNIIRIVILIVIAIASFYTGKLNERVKWQQSIADITWNCMEYPVHPPTKSSGDTKVTMVPEK